MSETKFPLHEEKLSFELPKTDAPREKILALGKKITDRVPAKLHGVTGEDPEYWGLAGLVTDEMADVALKMGVRKPKTLQQMVKLTGMEEKKLEQLLEEMAYIGLVEYHWENLDGKNPNHEKRYVLCRFVPGSAEFFNMRPSQIEEHPEVTAFFERMTFLPLEKITPMVPPGGAGIGIGVAAVMYFLNIIVNISDKAAFLRYVTPFTYCDGARISQQGSLDGKLVAVGLLLGAAGVAAAHVKFCRKDIR